MKQITICTYDADATYLKNLFYGFIKFYCYWLKMLTNQCLKVKNNPNPSMEEIYSPVNHAIWR